MKNISNKVTVLDTEGLVAKLTGDFLKETDPGASFESYTLEHPLFEQLTGSETSSLPSLIIIVGGTQQGSAIDKISKLKSSSTTGHIPIVVLCDLSQETERETMYNLKVNCHLTSSEDEETLGKIVQAIIHLWIPRQLV